MPHKAVVQEQAIVDLSKLRYVRKVETQLVEDGTFEYFGKPLREALQIVNMVSRIGHKEREVAVVLFLDHSDMPIGYDLWTGGIDFVAIDARQIFKLMSLLNASKVVFCHNHPEGRATPSRGDEMFCLQMCQLCKLMNWEVKDFIVVANPGYYSFKEQKNQNLLDFEQGPAVILP